VIDIIENVDDSFKGRLNFDYRFWLKNLNLPTDVIFEHWIHVNNAVLSSCVKSKLTEENLVDYVQLYSDFSDRLSFSNKSLINNADSVLKFFYKFFERLHLISIFLKLFNTKIIGLKKPGKGDVAICKQNCLVVA